MKTIWSGFDTTPHTLPDTCLICFGDEGGDFITLSCGHGAPHAGISEHETPLIHVGCLLRSFQHTTPKGPRQLLCPICRTQADQDTLADLVRYLRNGSTVTFPNEDDQKQDMRLYNSLPEALDLFEQLVEVQKRAGGKIDTSPTQEEKQSAYWDEILTDLERFSHNAEEKMGSGSYTLEELTQERATFEAKVGRASAAAGRLVYFKGQTEKSIFGRNKLVYSDVYKRFIDIGKRLERVGVGLRTEERSLKFWEEKGKRHIPKIWNGLGTKPYTTPEACSVCHGSGRRGDFLILDCGHGSPKNSPLHVFCALDIISNAAKSGERVRCPTCQEPVGSGTFSRIAHAIYRNQEMSYPLSDGSVRKIRFCNNDHRKYELIQRLVKVQRSDQEARGVSTPNNEQARAHYTHVITNAESLIEQVERTIGGLTYTLDDINTDLNRLRQVQEFMDVSAGQIAETSITPEGRVADPFIRIYADLSRTENHLRTTVNRLKQEKTRLDSEQEKHGGRSRRIWSGFNTDPETYPRNCTVCFGQNGGEFITLDCGHGAAGNGPLHVGCVIETALNTTQSGIEPHCPVCEAPIGTDVISELADCVRRNERVIYPSDSGTIQRSRLCDDDEKTRNVLEALEEFQKVYEEAEEKKASEAQHDGSRVDDYDHFVTQMEELAGDVERGLEERSYTTEELADKQREMDDLNRRVTAFAERTRSQAERSTPLQEKYERLLDVREHLRTIEERLRQEKEAMQHHEEESERMHHPA